MATPFDPNQPIWSNQKYNAQRLRSTSEREWLPAVGPALIVVTVLFAVLLTGFLAPLHAQTDGCSNHGNSVEYAQCLGSKLTELRAQLDQSYRRALENVPNRSPPPSDIRQTTQQLRQYLITSQAAWQTYVGEICAYAGGVQGGSGVWIGIFEAQCLLKETKLRIDFLEHLPSGG